MKKRTLIIAAAVLWIFLSNGNATAGYLDDGWKNITTFDGYQGSGNKWWNTQNEDQEVEPGAAKGQQWDLEGFFMSDDSNENIGDNDLALVGGFDFANGESWVKSGDIFIDTDMTNDYYEYVLDLNFDISNPGKKSEQNNSTYTAYENTDKSIKFNTTHGGPSGGTQGQAWTYESGGTPVSGFEGLALNYLSKQNNNQIGGGLKGGQHNALFVDMSFLGANKTFTAWNALECGNDITKGGGTTSAAVPEPATIFLLGSGLLGLFGYQKKIRKTNI